MTEVCVRTAAEPTRINIWDAFTALNIPPSDSVLQLLRGVFDEENANARTVRLSMLTQLQRERSGGHLVHRGPHQDATTCTCSSEYWCSSWERWIFLRGFLEGYQFDCRVAFEGVKMYHPESCLANQECFEICFTRAIYWRHLVKVDSTTYRLETEAEARSKAQSFSKMSRPQRKKVFPSEPSPLDYL